MFIFSWSNEKRLIPNVYIFISIWFANYFFPWIPKDNKKIWQNILFGLSQFMEIMEVNIRIFYFERS